MRLLARLRAKADTAYDHTYHHKLRGGIWRALKHAEYEQYHDEKTLLVAAPQEAFLLEVAEDLMADRELNIGEMPFHVDKLTSLAPDVGELGTTGTIETGTGFLIRIPPWRAEEYGIDHPSGAVVAGVM